MCFHLKRQNNQLINQHPNNRSLGMLLTVLKAYMSQLYLVFRYQLAGMDQSVDDRNVSQ